jgi:hypothetical protein
MEAIYCMPPMIVREYSPRWYPGIIWITSFSAGAVAGELCTEAPKQSGFVSWAITRAAKGGAA